jgi:hypothetical protein
MWVTFHAPLLLDQTIPPPLVPNDLGALFRFNGDQR